MGNEGTKVTRHDAELLRALRAELIERTQHRTDTLFVHVFGDSLDKLSDRRILDMALGKLLEFVYEQPDNKTGLAWFDDRPVVEGKVYTADKGARLILDTDGVAHQLWKDDRE